MIWFKIYVNETLADEKLLLLDDESFGIRIKLMCYVAKSPIMNYLYRTEGEPFSDDEISTMIFRGLQDRLQKWLQIKNNLLKNGGFSIDENGAFGIPKFAENQSDYYRQKKYRVTQKVTNGIPTINDNMVTDKVTKELHIESKSKSKSKSKLDMIISPTPLSEIKPINEYPEFQEILDAWNILQIPHRILSDHTPQTIFQIKERLKNNSGVEVILGIKNYGIIRLIDDNNNNIPKELSLNMLLKKDYFDVLISDDIEKVKKYFIFKRTEKEPENVNKFYVDPHKYDEYKRRD